MLREENETRNPQSANPARVCREAASVQPLVTSSSPVIHAEKNDAPREGKNAPSIRAAACRMPSAFNRAMIAENATTNAQIPRMPALAPCTAWTNPLEFERSAVNVIGWVRRSVQQANRPTTSAEQTCAISRKAPALRLPNIPAPTAEIKKEGPALTHKRGMDRSNGWRSPMDAPFCG